MMRERENERDPKERKRAEENICVGAAALGRFAFGRRRTGKMFIILNPDGKTILTNCISNTVTLTTVNFARNDFFLSCSALRIEWCATFRPFPIEHKHREIEHIEKHIQHILCAFAVCMCGCRRKSADAIGLIFFLIDIFVYVSLTPNSSFLFPLHFTFLQVPI